MVIEPLLPTASRTRATRRVAIGDVVVGGDTIPIIAGPAECTALGNILVQAIALGHLPSLAAAREVVRNSFEVTTVKPQSGAEWDGAFGRFEKLIKRG